MQNIFPEYDRLRVIRKATKLTRFVEENIFKYENAGLFG
jgi:hypothetical protein